LSEPEVIQQVTRCFVPVALNRLSIRQAKGASGDFFRAVEKQRPKQYQGIWIVSPEGKVLGSHDKMLHKPGEWGQAMLRVIDDSLTACGGVSTRKAGPIDLLPDRGVGERADGSIVLVVHTRFMLAGLDPKGFVLGPTFDSVILSKEDRADFELPGLSAGDDFKIDTEVVRKLHKVLSPNTDVGTLPRADEVTRAALRGKVVRVRDASPAITSGRRGRTRGRRYTLT
jgi:hypothetical protein